MNNERRIKIDNPLKKRLSAYEVYKKALKENLTREQCKQFLLDNGIIKKKVTGTEAG
jgi:hypothetical protein